MLIGLVLSIPVLWVVGIVLALVGAVMLLLGFSSGIPIYLVGNTLGFWMRENAIELSTIGFLSWVGLAYSLKFLWAPLVDKLDAPLFGRWLGRRRGWMLLAQLVVAAALVGMAVVKPRLGDLVVGGFAIDRLLVFGALALSAIVAFLLPVTPPAIRALDDTARPPRPRLGPVSPDPKPSVEAAVELLVYAPLGFALEARSLLPGFIERGRNQVTMARMIGQFAVQQGQVEAAKRLGPVQALQHGKHAGRRHRGLGRVGGVAGRGELAVEPPVHLNGDERGHVAVDRQRAGRKGRCRCLQRAQQRRQRRRHPPAEQR